MATDENVAQARRVDHLERAILAVEPIRITTIYEIHRRGAEPRCATVADVYRNAKLAPVTEMIERRPGLDVLIDAEEGVHLHRVGPVDPEFEELAEGVRVVEVVISCYPEQLEQIESDAPITATEGGTRAGKTRVLVWWLFRQWLLRGHGVVDGHEIEAVFWWVREDSKKLFKHGVMWLLRLWPPVFVGKIPTKATKDPCLELLDGSRIDFMSAALSGSKAGTQLRSESCEALVVDELSAIYHKENWREMGSRVAQTGGPIATAYTPTAGHWSDKLSGMVSSSGGAVAHARLTMFDNPWWKLADVWVDLLKSGALTATDLVEKVLAKRDQPAAALEAVTDPHVRRMRFGEKQPLGLTLWRCWADKYVVKDRLHVSDQLEVDGRALPNITAKVVGPWFGRSGRGIFVAGGLDFNINPGVAIIYQVFGTAKRPHVLVIDEVASHGPTLVSAEAIASRYQGLCLFCDPTGAQIIERHASHGSKGMSDAEEFRRAGLPCEPANGISNSGNVADLGTIDSMNVLHRAMADGLIRVHARCTGVLRALEEQKADARGRPAKTSGVNSISDQVSAYGDATRYGLWRVYQHLLMNTSPFLVKGAA